MSSGGGTGAGRTIADIDREAIDKYHKSLKASLDREARMTQHALWRGNKMQPFDIEPMMNPRERLAGAGMTDQDRMLRRQYLMDQELAPNEPRYVPELHYRNPFRRVLAVPWNAITGVLRPIVGERRAASVRWMGPKLGLIIGGLYVAYYHIRYNPNQWTDKHGWNVSITKPTLITTGAPEPEKVDSDFYDRGFKHRKVLLYNDVENKPTQNESFSGKKRGC